MASKTSSKSHLSKAEYQPSQSASMSSRQNRIFRRELERHGYLRKLAKALNLPPKTDIDISFDRSGKFRFTAGDGHEITGDFSKDQEQLKKVCKKILDVGARVVQGYSSHRRSHRHHSYSHLSSPSDSDSDSVSVPHAGKSQKKSAHEDPLSPAASA